MRSQLRRTPTLLALALAASAAFVGARCYTDSDDVPDWSEELPGDVVYAAQEAGVSSIYRVSANGTGRVQLFKNDDDVDPDALYPVWAEGGRKIRFTAMRDGVWAGFEMDADGAAPHADGDAEFRLLSVRGADPDLLVADDGIYHRDDAGERRLIHREPVERGRVAYANAAWGPERRYVIFQACDQRERCEVRVARSDGSGAFTVARGRHPSWNW